MSHNHANVLIHVIFGTKGRRPLILPEHAESLYAYMAGIARKEFGFAVRIGGTSDHVHASLRTGTDLSIGEVMSKFKSHSSGWAHKTIPALRDLYWQEGYGVFSVSKSQTGSVVKYIERQAAHHKRGTFQEEFVDFLDRHEIEYGPERIWE